VRNLFTRFLKRQADAGGLNAFTTALANGATIEQVEAALVGSPEYFQSRGGGTNNGFLDAIYQDALNRAVDSAGRTFFGQLFANGATTTQVATLIFTSDEFRTNLVQGFYQTFLHRAADSGGLATFVGLLRQGRRDEEVVAGIASSDEYFGRLS
jgi:hypothetical protein